ncbi:hypothetical protein AGMMS49940_23860 [Spirochaetia bacterium]|nr:hypothetical protein AGMMS49940_23860 [Spirochaetia bacterium]
MGIKNGGGIPLGSGGWLNIIEKYAKAKKYCTEIFEVQRDKFHKGNKKIVVPIYGEWIGDNKDDSTKRILDITCQDAASIEWEPNSLDGVFTDPPYFGNVQYAELMDFCYVWLRNLVQLNTAAFAPVSTRNENELTGNDDMQRGLGHFTQGLSTVFTATANALKPHAPFVFTYHHNDITAYYPVAAAILDAGLYCSKVLPCPTEMSASIHIKGTVSSIIDSIFICRHKKYMTVDINEDLDELVKADISALLQGDYTPTKGDIRCIAHGHIIRKCVNVLSKKWDAAQTTETKLSIVSQWFSNQTIKESLNELMNLTVSKKEKEYCHEFVLV